MILGMPATRTTTRQQLRKTSPTHSRANDLDLTSSSPESTAHTGVLRKKRDQTQRPKAKVPLGEVIEISSDDEPPPPINPAIVDLRKQVKKLKEENARFKTDLANSKKDLIRAQEEIVELKTSKRPVNGELLLDVSQLDDHVNCEICTARMWSPHILPECGHTFCQSCLQDWFSTTLAQFMASHPHYNVNDPAPHLRHFQPMFLMHHPHAAAYLAQMQQQNPQPEYTCPTCREPVKNRPAEDFALKALVRTIAAATGENSPRKPVAEQLGRGKARAPVRTSGPWDGFFPRAG
ncbi:hypothetical protein Hypma_008017 [Hypsizygus marmoreus]|uniref:RING-type domain-containing protein n=1 Tax=Hypsizygus marmoreus TaxID=39966 RepID=A0A369JXH9_HYPMA|nr:hypothetical protein Hypma_008017 [Hypsizygus marmoreus]